MRFQCNYCRYPLKDVPSEMLGKRTDCPNCGHHQIIPNSPFGLGRLIGDFIIGTKIGEGSIGTVYLARQISLDRTVALKILSRRYTNEKGITSFLSEARAAAKLNHPNIVQVFAVGEEDGTCFMAMNYVQGKTVKQRIEQTGRISVDEALHIIQQIAEALYFAWTEQKIIHRDVKPENIMITNEGMVKLTDLGLAIHEEDCKDGMEISGTPYYMSPEQFTGEKLDQRTDIYSLGVTLYEMLSAKLPFEGKNVDEVAKKHFYEEPPSLKKIVDQNVPPELFMLLGKMLAKHPDDRFQNWQSLIEYVWKIRQKTAPDKDLVPGIHTISIKKMEYKPQKQAKIEQEKHIEKHQEHPVPSEHSKATPHHQEPPAHYHIPHRAIIKSGHIPPLPAAIPELVEEENSIKINKYLLITVSLIIIIFILIYFVSHAEKSKKVLGINRQLASIENRFYGTDTFSSEIEKECLEVLEFIGQAKTSDETVAVLKLRLIIMELKNRKLQFENRNISTELANLQGKSKVIYEEFDKKKKGRRR